MLSYISLPFLESCFPSFYFLSTSATFWIGSQIPSSYKYVHTTWKFPFARQSKGPHSLSSDETGHHSSLLTAHCLHLLRFVHPGGLGITVLNRSPGQGNMKAQVLWSKALGKPFLLKRRTRLLAEISHHCSVEAIRIYSSRAPVHRQYLWQGFAPEFCYVSQSQWLQSQESCLA